MSSIYKRKKPLYHTLVNASKTSYSILLRKTNNKTKLFERLQNVRYLYNYDVMVNVSLANQAH